MHQDTFLNFEYDIWYDISRGNKWNLERPSDIFSQSSFRTYQNSSNYSDLRQFKSDVDALNAAEWAAISLTGMATFKILRAAVVSHAAISSGGALTTQAINSIISAIGATSAAGVAIGVVCSTYNDCNISYKKAFNDTNNIH